MENNPFTEQKEILDKNIASKVGDRGRGWLETPFSIAITRRGRGGRNSFPRIAPLYPWYVPYIPEC